MIAKENFDNWQVGMVVFHKMDNTPLIVEKFIMDDFCEDHFCDRLECSWDDGTGLKKQIFNYEDIEITGVHKESY